MKALVYTDKHNEGELREIPDTLEGMQELVGGYIEEHIFFTPGNCYLWIGDDEGKLKGKPATRSLFGTIIVGTIIVCALNLEDGQTYTGLTEQEAKELDELFDKIR